MHHFIDSDFMLTTDSARELYHTFAEHQPIIDYHCHLSPAKIADNHCFGSITEAWLDGDHYKWRAMRGNGISEHFVTGAATDYEKFEKWAATLPYTMRNPLYHWTHLELKQIFGIDAILKPETAREIYDECNRLLAREDFRVRGLMGRFNVEALCTTDDPTDSLTHHQRIAKSGFSTKVLPTWRADKAMAVEDAKSYNDYLDKLSEAADVEIVLYRDLIEALRIRQEFFAANGCKLSDHGLDTFYSEPFTGKEIECIFRKIRAGNELNAVDVAGIKSALLYDLAVMDSEKGWVQQFHIGAIRNSNSKMLRILGADTGYDAIHDLPCAAAGHRFFDKLESAGKLAKTILYNLNPKDNEVLATMAYTFNDGSTPGKMQFGSGWWFLDQEDGMRKQINALSALGLLSRFVGMLTDSRSFLSYPRHDYFRRILCDVIGSDIESGRLPRSEMAFFGSVVEDICYNNVKAYIGLTEQ